MEQSDLDRVLGEELSLIASSVNGFAQDRVAPRHEELDHAGVHPEDLWAEIAEMGLFATFVPEALGGAGAGFLAHVLTIEELSRAAGLAGALVTAQGVVLDALVLSGDEEACGRHLEATATGEAPAAPALVEDDQGHVATAAEGAGRDVRLTGSKVVVPFPGRAGLYLVRARRGDGEDVLVLVAPDAEGLAHGEAEPNLGFAGLETGALGLHGTPGRVLGGPDLVARVLAGARIAVAGLLCGVGRGAVDHATRYAGERVQFDRPIRGFTAIQELLVGGDARVAALRGLVHAAARLRDAGEPHGHAARRARWLAAEAPVQAAHAALQVYGGYGYSREYPVERFYRDARFPGFGEHVPHRTLEESMDALGP